MPLKITSSAVMVTTLPLPLPLIAAPVSPRSLKGVAIVIGP